MQNSDKRLSSWTLDVTVLRIPGFDLSLQLDVLSG